MVNYSSAAAVDHQQQQQQPGAVHPVLCMLCRPACPKLPATVVPPLLAATPPHPAPARQRTSAAAKQFLQDRPGIAQQLYAR
jgi:hypothetical protein